MDRAGCLEGAKRRRCVQEVRLVQRQLDVLRHCSLHVHSRMYKQKRTLLVVHSEAYKIKVTSAPSTGRLRDCGDGRAASKWSTPPPVLSPAAVSPRPASTTSPPKRV